MLRSGFAFGTHPLLSERRLLFRWESTQMTQSFNVCIEVVYMTFDVAVVLNGHEVSPYRFIIQLYNNAHEVINGQNRCHIGVTRMSQGCLGFYHFLTFGCQLVKHLVIGLVLRWALGN